MNFGVTAAAGPQSGDSRARRRSMAAAESVLADGDRFEVRAVRTGHAVGRRAANRLIYP